MSEKEKIKLNESYILNREHWTKIMGLSRDNPSIMLSAGLNYLSEVTEGKLDVVDASNPMTLAMEMGATIGANNFTYFKQTDAMHYPSLATKVDDLYHHMSDELYEGRFASPARATFYLVLKKAQILRYAVDSDIDGIRKLVIPRGTYFQVDGVIFTLLNPLIIRVSSYDAIQVIYDTTDIDPLEGLESNMVEYFFGDNGEGEECIFIDVNTLQISKRLEISELTSQANPYHYQYHIDDEFVLARAYIEDPDTHETKEIRATHSDLVYDPNHVTVQLKLKAGNMLEAYIPIMYYNSGLMRPANVILEIYTTKGPIEMPLRSLTDDYSTYIQYDNKSVYKYDQRFIEPLKTMDSYARAKTDTSGGNHAVGFDKLKEWVIQGGQYKEAPITHANIQMNAEYMGYELVIDVDHLTNRIFQATRELSPGVNSEFTRGAGCSIESVLLSTSMLAAHPHVNVHEDRMTLLPSALFHTRNGQTVLLTDAEVPKRQGTSIDEYIRKANSLEYIFTPFYYCLDDSGVTFEARAYYLDNPRFISQQFAAINNGLGLVVSVDRIFIKKMPWGYQVDIISRSDDAYKKLDTSSLWCQLGFKANNQTEYAYTTGEFLGYYKADGEVDENHHWRFRLETSYDFSSDDELILNNFKILTLEDRKLPCELETDFSVVFGVYDISMSPDAERMDISHRSAPFLLDRFRTPVAIAENTIKLHLGYALTNLWRNARTISSTVQYERYEHDIPVTYKETVFEDDENGVPIYTVSPTGEYEFKVKHHRGDIARDDEGHPILLHRKGDVKIDDTTGEPVVAKTKQVQRIIDIFFLDGIYRFADNADDINYIRTIPETINTWLITDIAKLSSRLLENTELFFMPKRTMGYISIIAGGGIKRTIFNRLPFTLNYYLTDKAFGTPELREAIRRMTHRVINDLLRERVISKDVIEHRLRQEGGVEHILGVEIIDMGIGSDINTFTMIGDGSQCSVRRKLALQSDGSLKVKEDINIRFINHERGLVQKHSDVIVN